MNRHPPSKQEIKAALRANLQSPQPFAPYYLQQITSQDNQRSLHRNESTEYIAYILSPYLISADSDWQDRGNLVFQPCGNPMEAELRVFSFCKQHNWQPLLWRGLTPIAQQIWSAMLNRE